MCRYLDPLAWGLYGIFVTQMGAETETVELSDGGHISISSYLLQTYNYDYSFRWQVHCLHANAVRLSPLEYRLASHNCQANGLQCSQKQLQSMQLQGVYQNAWTAASNQLAAMKIGCGAAGSWHPCGLCASVCDSDGGGHSSLQLPEALSSIVAISLAHNHFLPAGLLQAQQRTESLSSRSSSISCRALGPGKCKRGSC